MISKSGGDLGQLGKDVLATTWPLRRTQASAETRR